MFYVFITVELIKRNNVISLLFKILQAMYQKQTSCKM